MFFFVSKKSLLNRKEPEPEFAITAPEDNLISAPWLRNTALHTLNLNQSLWSNEWICKCVKYNAFTKREFTTLVYGKKLRNLLTPFYYNEKSNKYCLQYLLWQSNSLTVHSIQFLNRRKNGWTQFGKTSEARVTLGRHDLSFFQTETPASLKINHEKWILLYMMVKIGMLFKTSDCWYSCRRGVGEPTGWWPPCPLYSRLQSLLGSLPSPHSPPL